MTGRAGATYLIGFRIVQGVGAAFLLANSAAIITDAFPRHQRGTALGINNIVGVSGMFVGLVLGGLLAPINWRLVFLISVPVGLLGTVWAYLNVAGAQHTQTCAGGLGGRRFLRARADPDHGGRHLRHPARPWRHPTGWSSPKVLGLMGAGIVCLLAFAAIEQRAA